MRLLAALALCIPVGAAAADWTLVSSSTRATAGDEIELLVIAPEGESPPDELSLTVRADVADVIVPLRAEAPAEGTRRVYRARLPDAA